MGDVEAQDRRGSGGSDASHADCRRVHGHEARARCLPEPWMCDVFLVDGSLRDIRVLDVERADWIAVLDHLRSVADVTEVEHPYAQLDPVRPAVADLFRAQWDEPEGQGTNFAFRARFDGVWFCALPYDEEEIEFSLWPDDVVDGADVAAVLRFLTEVGTACGRRVLLTGETTRYHPNLPTLIHHDPTTGLSHGI
ncbi:hypothetical protein [Streptomyces sp. NPDC001568]|uniref:hypothetical protein n=1 Tax=Streptomyces sp. NPDC001568 TaxID=3364588 RepID=UPI003695C240